MRSVISLVVAVLASSGCATETPEPVEPTLCPDTIPLDGAASGATTVGPLELGSASICLHLDAQLNANAHFTASTTLREHAATSSYVLRLTQPDGTMILEGWDVTVGQSDPQTFVNLELPVDGGTERDVVLTVEAKGENAPSTSISIEMFEPVPISFFRTGRASAL